MAEVFHFPARPQRRAAGNQTGDLMRNTNLLEAALFMFYRWFFFSHLDVTEIPDVFKSCRIVWLISGKLLSLLVVSAGDTRPQRIVGRVWIREQSADGRASVCVYLQCRCVSHTHSWKWFRLCVSLSSPWQTLIPSCDLWPLPAVAGGGSSSSSCALLPPWLPVHLSLWIWTSDWPVKTVATFQLLLREEVMSLSVAWPCCCSRLRFPTFPMMPFSKEMFSLGCQRENFYCKEILNVLITTSQQQEAFQS